MSNEECRNQGAPFRQFIVIERAGNFQEVQVVGAGSTRSHGVFLPAWK